MRYKIQIDIMCLTRELGFIYPAYFVLRNRAYERIEITHNAIDTGVPTQSVQCRIDDTLSHARGGASM